MAGLFFVANADYSQAQVIFDNGAENIVDMPQPFISSSAIARMGDPTTVLIQDGAVIPENNPDDDQSIIVEDNSIVEMSGGLTDGHFDTFDTAMGLFTGGTVGDEVRAFGNSMITIGTPMMMAQVLDIEDDLFADENGFIEMYEGRVFDDAEIFGNSRLIIYGGEVDEDVEAFDNTEITIFGGLFNTGFSDPDDIEGASISTENSDDLVPNTAQINVRGGTFVARCSIQISKPMAMEPSRFLVRTSPSMDLPFLLVRSPRCPDNSQAHWRMEVLSIMIFHAWTAGAKLASVKSFSSCWET